MLERLAKMQKDGILHKPITALMELRMGCGFGFCYGCTVMTNDGPKLVCKDGPAMALETIDWTEENAPRVHL
jgi:aerobic-type carbon monoxide dehydrogenase small subunit (CoxS/CutS family)